VAEKEIKFKTIYFEKDDASILPSSITAVDSAYNILAGNPEINIEIQGHVNWPKQWEQFANTDGLQKLSEERAKAIYLNFVKKGISANRMKYKGFSNTKMNFPYATTESGMQMNRRVEIVVVKK
jgi:outer membrane protein OmpA-like peptidoglycan-associated protein